MLLMLLLNVISTASAFNELSFFLGFSSLWILYKGFWGFLILSSVLLALVGRQD